MKQFNRCYRLDIGDENDGIAINNLRVAFKIEKTIDKKPNPAQISIWNLNESHRLQLTSGLFKYLKLFVGYGELHMIYAGDIISAKSKRNGLDIIVELECSDGHVDYQQSFISQSLAGGNADSQVIGALSKTLQKSRLGAVQLNEDQVLPRGKVLHGATRDFLSRMAVRQNADWSIQNGELVFLPTDRVLENELIVLSQHTGMIGSPTHAENGLEVSCLLNPLIQIGSLIRVESIDSSNNGDYKVVRLSHQGDALGGEWQSQLELVSGQYTFIER